MPRVFRTVPFEDREVDAVEGVREGFWLDWGAPLLRVMERRRG